MDIDAFVAQLLNGQTPVLPALLPNASAAHLVDRLKAEADRHWRIDAHVSLRCADMIVHIGQTREDTGMIALGVMARGDALKLLNQTEAAWDTLEQAGDLFLRANDKVGWARTRIGRLGICVNLNRVETAMSEAEQARQIFRHYGEHEKLLRLEFNTAAVQNQLGHHAAALALFQGALATAESLGEMGKSRISLILNNMGYAEQELGNLRKALEYYQSAHAVLKTRQENSGAALTNLNIATVVQAQGQYRKALSLLYEMQEPLAAFLPSETAYAQRSMIECYLALNRYADARVLAEKFLQEHTLTSAGYNLPLVLLHLATCAAELNDIDSAQSCLDRASAIFHELNSDSWLADIQLRRARIALKLGDLDAAQSEVTRAAAFFEAHQRQVDYATANLLSGQIAFAQGDLSYAAETGRAAAKTARRCNMPALRYSAHLLLGQIAEKQEQPRRALRHYQAAAAAVEHVQRRLTITLRPGFLEDKQDALRSLIRLYLQSGQAEDAFKALERAKSQVWLNYLTNREQLRWTHDDPRTSPLIQELNRLREEHHWYYQLAHDQHFREVQRTNVQPQQAAQEVARRERQMRTLTEQLYLHSGEDEVAQTNAVEIAEIQAHLPDGAVLLEFYSSDAQTWVFTLDRHEVRAHLLPESSGRIRALVEQVQANFARVLRVGPKGQPAAALGRIARQLLQGLYAALFQPLEQQLAGCQRLIIVPYGVLHYLPFHLLHDGTRYLIESHEIVILPTAGLSVRKPFRQAEGAVVLTHTWDSRLPNTTPEGSLVRQRFDGDLYCDEQAVRAIFSSPPRQILHIAAHGQHRIDQPDFSYIQLGDGQLLTDDLLQYDLSYEMVTLSACETGRANITAGDELIGLGRGFLYAGAGALIASLWRVDDELTLQWMEQLYASLQGGQSKAAALRDADRALLNAHPELHPAFWGAFQLIGNADPLSTSTVQ